MEFDIEQVKTLVENGDKAALETYLLQGVGKDDVKSVLSTNKEVKSFFDSEKDTHHHTALETWKRNNLDKLVQEKVKEINPDLTEEQKRIAALEKDLQDQRNEAKREKLRNKAITHATEKQLPSDLIDFFIGDDEDSTTENLGKFESTFTSAVQKAVESRFKDNGREIPSGGQSTGGKVESFSELAQKNNIRNQ